MQMQAGRISTGSWSGFRKECPTAPRRYSTASTPPGCAAKVGKNQTKAIRVILTGTHEQMMEIANGGRLDSWIDANLKWLRETFGNENLVSCVLHMDEKTPHLHATVVPIVAGERVRRKREGERKYETKSGPRLSGRRCDAAHQTA